MTGPGAGTTTADRFSEQIRAATWDAHEAVADSAFMGALVGGSLPIDDYAALVAQHYFAYVELERAAVVMADDLVAGPFVFPELARVATLERDLGVLLGDEWRAQVAPSDATSRYRERLRRLCSTWPGGFIAHHYTRYLGDLSGGQIIGRAVERTYGFTGHAGAAFYDFDGIDDLVRFKAEYRRRLDLLPVDDREREHIVAEILIAYRHNREVIEDLDRRLAE